MAKVSQSGLVDLQRCSDFHGRGGVFSSGGIKTPTNLVLKPGQFSEVEGNIKKTEQVSMALKIVAKSGSFKSGTLMALKTDLGGWFMALRSPILKVDKMGLMFNGRRASAEVVNPINHEIGDREPLDPKLGYDGCKVMSMRLWLGLIVSLEPTKDWKSWPPNLQG
ncbi:hypothetical protein ACLB2K_063388 [Fragaria x ananassa]